MGKPKEYKEELRLSVEREESLKEELKESIERENSLKEEFKKMLESNKTEKKEKVLKSTKEQVSLENVGTGGFIIRIEREDGKTGERISLKTGSTVRMLRGQAEKLARDYKPRLRILEDEIEYLKRDIDKQSKEK